VSRKDICLPTADQAEAEARRAVASHALVRTCRTIREVLGFLDLSEMRDVSSFLVYESYLVHRTRAIRNNEPVQTFEEFLVSFHKREGGK